MRPGRSWSRPSAGTRDPVSASSFPGTPTDYPSGWWGGTWSWQHTRFLTGPEEPVNLLAVQLRAVF